MAVRGGAVRKEKIAAKLIMHMKFEKLQAEQSILSEAVKDVMVIAGSFVHPVDDCSFRLSDADKGPPSAVGILELKRGSSVSASSRPVLDAEFINNTRQFISFSDVSKSDIQIQ